MCDRPRVELGSMGLEDEDVIGIRWAAYAST